MPSHPQTIDAAQTRAAMRALGIGNVVVTPTSEGSTFAGATTTRPLAVVRFAHRKAPMSTRFIVLG